MERRFVSDITFDLEVIRERNASIAPPWRQWLYRVICTLWCLLVLWAMVRMPELLTYYGAGFAVGLFLTRLRTPKDEKAYRAALEENGGLPTRHMISVTEGGIHYWDPETKDTADVAFSQVTGIRRTRRLLVLILDDGSTRLIDHSRVTGGTAAELEAFLLKKCDAQRIVRHIDSRMFRKAAVWCTVIGFLWSFLGIYHGFEPQPKLMTAREASAVLEELGIDPPPAEDIAYLEEYGATAYMVLEVLYSTGMGTYDYGTYAWTPAQSGVYAFDLEVWDVGQMYTNFLRGVSAMSRGALEFTDVREDDSNVDLESGTGWKEVTLTHDGQTRTFRVELNSDWFDPDFANDLARFLGADSEGRRLWFLYDGYQDLYVFYCDDDWADAFADATGYILSKRVA